MQCVMVLLLPSLPAGNDFTGCCFCFDPYRLDSSNLTAGSMEGELLAGHFNKPPGDENPGGCWAHQYCVHRQTCAAIKGMP